MSFQALERNVAVVVHSLKRRLLFRGGRARYVGNVVKRITVFGGQEFKILYDNVHSGAFYALVVFVIAELNTTVYGNLFAFLCVTSDGFC